ncbi:MAG: hypothetical protein A2X80_02025 [Geobacteraceae bacterium GWB2_52_12]|nr:MAG: hypothetical protein A2X80_02025 [Geobacteraceae bacterium GWB2_52_12]
MDAFKFLREHHAEIVDAWVNKLLNDQSSPYCREPEAELRQLVNQATDAFSLVLNGGDWDDLDAFISFIARRRLSQGFKLSEVQKAFILYQQVVTPILIRETRDEELGEAIFLLGNCISQTVGRFSDFFQRLYEESMRQQAVMLAERKAAAVIQENVRIKREMELHKKELLLLRQNRLAALGELISNIAHQWRQPLNLLGLFVQELSMTYKKGDFSAEYLDANVGKMMKTINHMSKTIDDFRDFTRSDKEKVDFRVLEVIKKAISLMEVSLNVGQIKTAVVSACDPVVNGYPNEFSQALINIMINARDAFVTQKVSSPIITIETGLERDRCVVTITDNAGGIPADIIDKIFDPYFTTKEPDKGTGVGLYMSKTIIEKNMGGTLSARNVDGGAQFRIVL